MIHLKVEIWSDFVCPFCYIGKRRFEAALERFAHRSEVEVVYRSFELDPNRENDNDESVHEMLASKYGMSVEQAKAANDNVARQAAQVGLTYRFDEMVVPNTFDAHRLTHFAAERGKQEALTERLLKAHFTENLHLGRRETLADLAAEVGLDRGEAAAMLESGRYADAVRGDEREAAALGCRGVPFFVLDRKFAVSGAQPENVFAEALQSAWEASQPALSVIGDETDAACADGVCAPTDAPKR